MGKVRTTQTLNDTTTVEIDCSLDITYKVTIHKTNGDITRVVFGRYRNGKVEEYMTYFDGDAIKQLLQVLATYI